MTETLEERATERAKFLASIVGFNYSAVFVPQSLSRNAEEKDPTINWRVTIASASGTLATDYTQGIAHMPKYRHEFRRTTDTVEREKLASEKGMYATQAHSLFHQLCIPIPKLDDVLYSLVMDASALNSDCFEDWASDTGYDPDSIKARKLYDECIVVALKVRAVFGRPGLAALQDLFQDY